MKILICLAVFTFTLSSVTAQNPVLSTDQEKPKLVVGIVVDQMRYDYLSRFNEKYGAHGFKRLINEGYNFKNAHFNYVPTYTGPGHTSVYTGTTPQNHGIIGNNWYDKFEGKMVYCTGDEHVNPVGTSSSAGKMSPHRMIATTVADENRLFTQLQGKTIGIALKDRGAILPAGHTANAAYWFHGSDEGKFISSDFYMQELPRWVRDFNDSGKAASYLTTWNTLNDINTYTESGSDLNEFEGGFSGKKAATFPYDLAELKAANGEFDLLKVTPFGNSITTDFALQALEGESLGQDDFTDFLTISYSSTDYIGHNFGVNSKEVQDTYLRLDLEIARLLDALDEKVGEGNYTVFLTSDHGGVDVPAYLESLKIPSGYFDGDIFSKKLNEFIKDEFDEEGLVENISNYQIFFNYEEVAQTDINHSQLEEKISHFILQYPQISRVFTRSQLQGGQFESGTGELIQNGFNQKRSGDVFMVPDPATISYPRTGSTHGSGFPYDTHAPLIFFGNGIPQGNTSEKVVIPDIAPTISTLLGISFPNSSTGEPLYMMLDNQED